MVTLFGVAPSTLGLRELNNQLRYGQYHISMGVDGLIFTKILTKKALLRLPAIHESNTMDHIAQQNTGNQKNRP